MTLCSIANGLFFRMFCPAGTIELDDKCVVPEECPSTNTTAGPEKERKSALRGWSIKSVELPAPPHVKIRMCWCDHVLSSVCKVK